MHLPTLILVTLAVNAVIGCYLFIIYQRKPKDTCFLFWSLSCAAFVIGGIISTLRAYNLPELLTYFVAELFLLAAPILIFIGLMQFSRLQFRLKHQLFAGAALVVYAMVLFVYHSNHLINTLVSGASLVIVFAACVVLLHKAIIIEPVFTRLLKNVFLLHCLVISIQTLLLIKSAPVSASTDMLGSAKVLLFSHIILTTFTALILPWLSFLKLERKLTLKSQRDGLTNIANRNHFFEQGTLLWRKDHHQHVIIMMIDIDHFKLINDQYGHVAGDIAIKETVKVLSKQLRSSDILGRIGGEEFAVVLPRTSIDIGQKIALRLLHEVEKNTLEFEQQTAGLTISIGLAEVIPSSCSFEDAYKTADKALYESKNGGRNRLTISSAQHQLDSGKSATCCSVSG